MSDPHRSFEPKTRSRRDSTISEDGVEMWPSLTTRASGSSCLIARPDPRAASPPSRF
jgi:hypothetical protein